MTKFKLIIGMCMVVLFLGATCSFAQFPKDLNQNRGNTQQNTSGTSGNPFQDAAKKAEQDAAKKKAEDEAKAKEKAAGVDKSKGSFRTGPQPSN
jgi:hypothetical protein